MDGKSQTDSRSRAAGLYMHSNIPLRIRFSYFSGRGMRKYGKFRLNSAHSLKRVTPAECKYPVFHGTIILGLISGNHG